MLFHHVPDTLHVLSREGLYGSDIMELDIISSYYLLLISIMLLYYEKVEKVPYSGYFSRG